MSQKEVANLVQSFKKMIYLCHQILWLLSILS